jgi:sigma54-dependent transcription regulator
VLQSGGSDIRCIAATQKDLSALVEQGLFRQDLSSGSTSCVCPFLRCATARAISRSW